jgi:hypothetical protein
MLILLLNYELDDEYLLEKYLNTYEIILKIKKFL